MNTKFDLSALGDNVVYVKAVPVASLPSEMRDRVGDLEQLFAVHRADGEQIALVADRQLAFILARQHDMVPMTVH
ncbi:MAG: DUF1150 family protein [Limimaricola sp.]|uniref:DUF1150 family protein n=1 Tax=Limimaricola sp. TaxID=2211665 RepID=UPI001E1912F0|nr:DUF1150 family protein [Limimaricola sp.]MBI1417820.1 DUF1150 family protein [Limimaricola sp.]